MFKMDYLIIFTILQLIITCSHGQTSEKLTRNPCAEKLFCSDCIQTPTCAWCMQPNFNAHTRCYQPSPISSCGANFVYNPYNEKTPYPARALTRSRAEISEEEEFSYASDKYDAANASASASAKEKEVVQIYPQRVHLKLRIKESQRIEMRYAQAADYPVDLYYLMDLSKSMEDDKDKLSVLGDLLAASMQKKTGDFRIGFGSFVDKVVMPYVSMVPKNVNEPCKGCAAPYGFHNVLELSPNAARFSDEVRNANVSGNLDAPEGGFDAIMQAVVCRKEIGWREKARRLLVFSTDAGFHYAGDGKLGGIVKPNDGLCHLDEETHLYTHSKLQDYPSISQINLKVKENAINVIFAVTKEQYHVYNKLRGFIEGSTCGVLSNDSSNVVDLVKEQYSQISSSVEMKDNASSSIKVTYSSQCLGGSVSDTNKCSGLKVGDVVGFSVNIEAQECPKDRKDWNQTIQIYPVGINESLIVDLELLCECPCEKNSHSTYEPFSPQCNDIGDLRCGKCECSSPFFGTRCECDNRNLTIAAGQPNKCRANNETQVDCNGRGNCICGRCDCEIRHNIGEEISGTFCECDNFSCERNEGILCSGPTHGICTCGVCECAENWIGPACNCPANNNSCRPANSTEGTPYCSGHGECDCGICKCDVEEGGSYSGKFCEMCPTCPNQCKDFNACVACQMFEHPDKPSNCPDCKFTPVPERKVEVDETKGEIFCTYLDKDHCRVSYKYAYDERNELVVTVQENPECPPKVFVLGIVLGVIAAIVLMGLAMLLMWKAITTIHDRREFAKFEKERMMAKWDTGENPIYKQATSTFKNPTYAGK